MMAISPNMTAMVEASSWFGLTSAEAEEQTHNRDKGHGDRFMLHGCYPERLRQTVRWWYRNQFILMDDNA